MEATDADENTPLLSTEASTVYERDPRAAFGAVQTHSELFRLIEKSRFFKDPSASDVEASHQKEYPIAYNQV